jgi:hypothetical protein
MDEQTRWPGVPAETIRSQALETGVTEAEIRTIIRMRAITRNPDKLARSIDAIVLHDAGLVDRRPPLNRSTVPRMALASIAFMFPRSGDKPCRSSSGQDPG